MNEDKIRKIRDNEIPLQETYQVKCPKCGHKHSSYIECPVCKARLEKSSIR